MYTYILYRIDTVEKHVNADIIKYLTVTDQWAFLTIDYCMNSVIVNTSNYWLLQAIHCAWINYSWHMALDYWGEAWNYCRKNETIATIKTTNFYKWFENWIIHGSSSSVIVILLVEKNHPCRKFQSVESYIVSTGVGAIEMPGTITLSCLYVV